MRVAAFSVCLFLFISSISLAQTMLKKDTVSYSFGLIMADEIKKSGFSELDRDVLIKAMDDYMAGTKTDISIEDAKKIVSTYKIEKQKKSGLDFLALNGKRAGVKTTPSGLQYEVIAKGPDGPKPTASDKVKVHYEGSLIDGTVFDSSIKRGEPISFPLNGVIKGWTEGLQLMTVGDKFRFFIPQELAYGARGAGGSIPPYSALVFEVELIGINQ